MTTRPRKRQRTAAPPDVQALVRVLAESPWQPASMEFTAPFGDTAGLAQSPLATGVAFGVAVGLATYGAASLFGMPPEGIASWVSLNGGLTAALGMVVWSVSMRREGATQYIEFAPAGASEPVAEPATSNARFIRPDTSTGQMVQLPGDWTPERLQAFSRRLVERDYDLTVRAWSDFCSYEQLKTLLDWLQERGMVQQVDGRGARAVRTRRVFEAWARGDIDAL